MAFSSSGCIVTIYQYAFIYRTSTVPSQHIAGFPKNGSPPAELVKAPGTHPDDLLRQYNGSFTDVYCPSPTDSAFISNVLWPPKKFTKPGSLERLQETEKSVPSLIYILKLFTPGRGAVLDRYGHRLPWPLQLWETREVVYRLERNCFVLMWPSEKCIPIKILAIHDVLEPNGSVIGFSELDKKMTKYYNLVAEHDADYNESMQEDCNMINNVKFLMEIIWIF